jgi:hypothetical protein
MRNLDEVKLEFQDYQFSIKRKNRFFVEQKYLDYFNRFIKSNTIIVEENAPLYRSRINKVEQNNLPYEDKEINMPPPGIISTSGRANPIGINYFYLSSNKATSISEIRPSIDDFITVASFTTTNELKIVEIGNMVGISGAPDESGYDDTKKVMHFMLILMREFTRPIKGIAEIEYAPFQYFAEYCKMNGLDGIRFFSSVMEQDGENYNYVLFSNEKTRLVEKIVVKIKGINYTFDGA